jgi:hypothetical protein
LFFVPGENCVYIISAQNAVKAVLGRPGKQDHGPGLFHDPAGAAFIPRNRVIVADSKHSRVQVFNSETGQFIGCANILAPEEGKQWPPIRRFAGIATGCDGSGGGREYVALFHLGTRPGFTLLELSC